MTEYENFLVILIARNNKYKIKFERFFKIIMFWVHFLK